MECWLLLTYMHVHDMAWPTWKKKRLNKVAYNEHSRIKLGDYRRNLNFLIVKWICYIHRLDSIRKSVRRYKHYTLHILSHSSSFSVRSVVSFSPVPNSPAAIKAVVSSSSSITVSWQPPLEPNGQLTKYTLYISVIQDASQTRRDGLSMRKRTAPADTNKFQVGRS